MADLLHQHYIRCWQ